MHFRRKALQAGILRYKISTPKNFLGTSFNTLFYSRFISLGILISLFSHDLYSKIKCLFPDRHRFSPTKYTRIGRTQVYSQTCSNEIDRKERKGNGKTKIFTGNVSFVLLEPLEIHDDSSLVWSLLGSRDVDRRTSDEKKKRHFIRQF